MLKHVGIHQRKLCQEKQWNRIVQRASVRFRFQQSNSFDVEIDGDEKNVSKLQSTSSPLPPANELRATRLKHVETCWSHLYIFYIRNSQEKQSD